MTTNSVDFGRQNLHIASVEAVSKLLATMGKAQRAGAGNRVLEELEYVSKVLSLAELRYQYLLNLSIAYRKIERSMLPGGSLDNKDVVGSWNPVNRIDPDYEFPGAVLEVSASHGPFVKGDLIYCLSKGSWFLIV